MYQPSQEGAGTISASEIAITISATSIWNPALHHAHPSFMHAQAHSSTKTDWSHTSLHVTKPQRCVSQPLSAQNRPGQARMHEGL